MLVLQARLVYAFFSNRTFPVSGSISTADGAVIEVSSRALALIGIAVIKSVDRKMAIVLFHIYSTLLFH